MRLDELTRPDLVFPDVPGGDRATVLRELAKRLAERGVVKKPKLLYERLHEREELGSTAIGSGIAIPHCKVNGLSKVVVAVGLSRDGVDYDAEDGEPVRLLFLVVSPTNAPAAHLQSLAAISHWVRQHQGATGLLSAESPENVYELLCGEATE